ncbi:MAG: response regulator [Leptolyngbya sp. BL-A-14]
MRRWRRNLAIHCPRLPTHRLGWQADLASAGSTASPINWEYTLLNLWLAKRRITPEQAHSMVLSTAVEVLFDVEQATNVTRLIKHDDAASAQVNSAEVEDVIAKAKWRWQAWQDAKLAEYSPNTAPIIRQPEQLRDHCSVPLYQMLVQRLNGEHTLYDLAVQMQRGVTEVTASLLPFIQMGWVELIQVSDLPALIYPRGTATKPAPPPTAPPKALIACVDDSALVRNTMETLLTSAGYRFLGVDNALRAISVLLAQKPDLIFLDLVMPEANGYEVCEQLRKLSCFRHTPIVILTGSDGYSNRLRASFVKASGFLSKPLNAEAVLSEIRKHLEHDATNLSVTSR